MPYRIRSFSVVFVIGLMCLVLPASVTEAQNLPQGFEIEAGVQYGVQDPERPVTPGWILSSGFDVGRQSIVIEGTWHRESYVQEHPWDSAEVFREKHRSRYWMLLGGVRGGGRKGRVVPYYQVLAGGLAARFRRDYEWPDSIDTETANPECGAYVDGVLVHPCLNVPYPEFDEERAGGFVMQPGVGVDVNLRPRLALRLAADLPMIAGRDYFILRPKFSARMVVAFGR